ncbi:Co2+/Mg2+ efflux protein ApaG [Fodinibius sp. Rm-B-1B1-1]|uniref:Co2+/Mg2+ efflux protein ApaG n=1 Tax=Fodinibius alkaliphilus TaxID=3140241 RepID=UPI00315AE527
MYQPVFKEVSHDICVEVTPIYLEEESSPVTHKHVFAYFVTIRNMGGQEVQLLRRHWDIKDSEGEDHEVDGEGVIGLQPKISPGDVHKYNSFCVLRSYRGSMQGYYTMKRADGEKLNVQIPKFLLSAHILN